MDIKHKTPFILVITDTSYILWQGANGIVPIFIKEFSRQDSFPWDVFMPHVDAPLKIMIATSDQSFEEMDIRHLQQRSKERLRNRIKNAPTEDTTAPAVFREVLLQGKDSYLLIGSPVSKKFAAWLDELAKFWQGDITLSSFPAEITHQARNLLSHSKKTADILIVKIAETLFHIGIYKGHMKMLRAFSFPKNSDALVQDLADTMQYLHHAYSYEKEGVLVIGFDALPTAFPAAKLIALSEYLGHAPQPVGSDWDHAYIEKTARSTRLFTKFMWGPLAKKRRQQKQLSLLKFGSYGAIIISLILSTVLFINDHRLLTKSEQVHQQIAALAPHFAQPVSAKHPKLSFASFQKMKSIQEIFDHYKQAPEPSHMLAALHKTLGDQWHLKHLTWEHAYQEQMSATLIPTEHPLPPASFEALLETLKKTFTQYAVIVESSPFQSTERETYQVTKKPSYLHAVKLRFVKKGKDA